MRSYFLIELKYYKKKLAVLGGFLMSKKIAVLHIVSNLNKNGPAFVVNDLAIGLKNNNCDVFIASSGGTLEKDLEKEGITNYKIPIQRLGKSKIKYAYMYCYNFMKSLSILFKLVKRKKINIIHAHQPIPILLGLIVSRLTRTPFVTTAHNIYNPNSIVDRMYTKGDLIIAVSEQVRKSMINDFKVDDKKIFTVCNGINLKRLTINSDKESSIRNKYGIEKNCTLIGVVAGLRKQKGLNYFIEAAKLISNEFSNVKFIIVGDGELREELVELSSNLNLTDKIIFTGFREDVPQIIKELDIFCLSSLYEGLPISLLEALGNSKPVVVTAVGGIPELITNGSNGLLVPPRDPKKLADSLKRLISDKDLVESLKTNALKSIKENFSEQSMAIKHIDLYTKLLNSN